MSNYIYNADLGEGYFKKILPNGLTVQVYEMPDKSSAYALFSAKVGSVNREFMLGDEHVILPLGTAHFLEHKMFENEEGIDAFEQFSATGASANAYTSFDRTSYLFLASYEFEESLKILLDFVNRPYFTEATIAKEQGIIGQEIKMYLDSPDWQGMLGLFSCLYHTHPIKDDIAGTVESIAEITPDILYKAVSAFYRPSNMVVSVAGNVDHDRVFSICEECIKVTDPDDSVCNIEACEPEHIRSKHNITYMDVSAPQFSIGFKEIPFSKGEGIEGNTVLDILNEIIAGDTSPLYIDLYEKGLINQTFGSEVISGDGFLCTVFSGESKDPDAVYDALIAEIQRLRKEGVPLERFEECRRANIGDCILAFDSIELVASNLTETHFEGRELFDVISAAENVTAEIADDYLSRMYSTDRAALSVIMPKKGE